MTSELAEQVAEEVVFYEYCNEFNFEVARFVVEEAEEAIEPEFEDAVTVSAGEKAFPCINCEKICKPKAVLTRHVNAKQVTKQAPRGKRPFLY